MAAMESAKMTREQTLDAAWQRRRGLYIGCARKLAGNPELYDEVLRFLGRAESSGSESRQMNAKEWRALLEGRDARSAAEMILGWLVPDPGRDTRGGELDRLLSNCPLAALADEQIRSRAGYQIEKQTAIA